MKPRLLVTTSLERAWGANEEILFLGEWCKDPSRSAIWSRRSSSVCHYHWRDRKKLQIDHQGLEKLNEKFLSNLSNFLNEFHSVKRDKNYWRIIIGPWLLNYIPVLWDRWESLSMANQNLGMLDTFSLDSKLPRGIAKDFSNSIHFFDSDEWNHQIYIAIINFRKDLDIHVKKISSALYIREPRVIPELNLIKKLTQFIANLIDSLFRFFSFNNRRFVLFHSYFPRSFILKLSFRLGIFPGISSFLNQDITYPNAIDRSALTEINPCISDNVDKQSFENFVADNILKDIPICYLEGYKKLINIQSRLCNADNIFTANAHFASELFKVWSAEQQLKGAQLIISSHGGALYPLYTVFNHQEKIADYRIVWGQEWMDGHIRMPANKLSKKVINYNFSGDISLIDYDSQKYSYRCASIPMGPLVLDGYNQKKEFIQILPNNLKKILKVRPFPLGGWQTKARYQEDFGEAIISSEPSLSSTIQNSRLIICTYPQTTFSEAMFSGVPTMLLYEEKFWEVQPIYDELIIALKKSNIMHTSTDSAAQHLALIAKDPMKWWKDPKTITAREKFNN